jgi:hypothetical protein
MEKIYIIVMTENLHIINAIASAGLLEHLKLVSTFVLANCCAII